METAEQLTTTLIISFCDLVINEEPDTWSISGLRIQIVTPEEKWNSTFAPEDVHQLPEMSLIQQRTVPRLGARYQLNNWSCVTHAKQNGKEARKERAIWRRLAEKHLAGGLKKSRSNAGSGGESVSSSGSSVSNEEDSSESSMDTEEERERQEEAAEIKKVREDIIREHEARKAKADEEMKCKLAAVKTKDEQLKDIMAKRTGTVGWAYLNGMMMQPKDQTGAFLFPNSNHTRQAGARGGEQSGKKGSSDDLESSGAADVSKTGAIHSGSNKRKAPSSDSEASKQVLEEEIFLERQPKGSLTCGMHALNNLFQRNCRNSKARQQ